MNPMSTRLTPAGNGCNPERERGTRACREQGSPSGNHCMLTGVRTRCGWVNAKCVKPRPMEFDVDRNAAVVEALRHVGPQNSRVSGWRKRGINVAIVSIPATCAASHGEDNDQTGHPATSYLINRVNTGSPKRTCLTCSAWRRSRHISQTPRVTPRTAATADGYERNAQATDARNSAIRVKDGMFTRQKLKTEAR